mmetsp:Transcript_31241/g.88584  ORF Transcript_31241/g.88584 Transcript_31241/m.88584 type:complete len:257 (-) Transcript_31241:112-882(-)
MFGMFGKPNQLPEAKDCLPGREEEMHISNQHYVTGNPIKGPFPDNLEVTVFGTGCFWGTEKGFWRIPGVFSTAVGYAGGHTPNANYREVCSGLTGHNEVVQVVWDPTKVSYADLLIMFWTSHDPTQGMRQGNDAGTQYRSGIYYSTPEQKAMAEASMAAYQDALSKAGYGKITTELVESPTFYYAEDYHQQYLAKPGSRPYCSAQPTGVAMPPYSEWTAAGAEVKGPKLPDTYWSQHGPRPGCTIGFPNDQVVIAA